MCRFREGPGRQEPQSGRLAGTVRIAGSVAIKDPWTEDRASGATLKGGPATAGVGVQPPLRSLGLSDPALGSSHQPVHPSPRGGQLLPQGHAVPQLCTPHSVALELGRGALAFDADPHGSDLVATALRGRSARLWGLLPGLRCCLPTMGGCLPPPGPVPPATPGPQTAACPRERKGTLQHVLCPCPFLRPWSSLQPRRQLVGVPLQIPLGHDHSSRLTVVGMCLWGSDTHPCLQQGLVCSVVQGRPRDHRRLGEGELVRPGPHLW